MLVNEDSIVIFHLIFGGNFGVNTPDSDVMVSNTNRKQLFAGTERTQMEISIGSLLKRISLQSLVPPRGSFQFLSV